MKVKENMKVRENKKARESTKQGSKGEQERMQSRRKACESRRAREHRRERARVCVEGKKSRSEAICKCMTGSGGHRRVKSRCRKIFGIRGCRCKNNAGWPMLWQSATGGLVQLGMSLSRPRGCSRC